MLAGFRVNMVLSREFVLNPDIIMSPKLWGGGYIDFGEDPAGIGISVGVTLSCLHSILILIKIFMD